MDNKLFKKYTYIRKFQIKINLVQRNIVILKIDNST